MVDETEGKALIFVEDGDRELYQKIAQTKYFKGDRSELNLGKIFCLAMAIGFQQKRYVPLSKPQYITRKEYLIKNNHMRSFLFSVAIAHQKNLSILLNYNKVFEIAQSYANGGFKVLCARVFDKQSADFDKELETEILSLARKKFK